MSLEDTLVLMPVKARPYYHQTRAFEFACKKFGILPSESRSNGVALLMEMGTGKTLTSIGIAGALYQFGMIKRILVVAPLSIVGVWAQEFDTFADYPFTLTVLKGTSTQKAEQLKKLEAMPGLQIVVVNYESAWRIEKALLSFNADLIIADEAHKLKEARTSQSKAMHHFGDKARYKLLLTGTVITNRELDVFSQYRFLNRRVFGDSFYAFRNRYFDMVGYGNHTPRFRSHKIKEHFNLKSNFIKPLLQIYRELNKEYKDSKGNAKNLMSDLPDWYSVSSQGIRFLPGVLAVHMEKNEDVFYATEQFFRYKDGVYLEMSELEAQRLVQAKMLARETKMSQIVDAEHQWRLRIQKDLRELNANPYIINVKNGLFNVLEETLTEHTPNYYSTVQLNVNYNKKADCPRFKEFLKESMGGDMEQVALIQEMLGYFLIPINSAQKCFVIVGVAGAGKSVLLRVINDILLGKKNVSNVSWQALNERFKTAELFGKLANIFADLPTKNIDDNGIFKALVGEDYLTVEKKHKNPFSFQSCARLLFSCNSIPKNYGDRSEGFYRRLIIMRFNHTVPVEKRDPDLVEKFAAEADGIFLFALEGLKRLMSKQFVFSETEVNKAELQQYREDSDSVLSFIKECCEIDSNASVGSTEIFNAYKEYCEECGLKPYSQRSFVQQISASFPLVARGIDTTGKRRVLNGIKLVDDLY